jgi:hypothetical protein
VIVEDGFLAILTINRQIVHFVLLFGLPEESLRILGRKASRNRPDNGQLYFNVVLFLCHAGASPDVPAFEGIAERARKKYVTFTLTIVTV